MAKPVKTISSRVCAVCGAPATEPNELYMEPRCAEHAHNLLGLTGRVAKAPQPPEQRRAFWDLKPLVPPMERKPGMSPAFQADYGGLELRVLAHSMEQMAGLIAYEMSRITVMDLPTARSLVDATVRVLTSKGPLTPDDLRYQPPLMTATEINELPPKAREYIHQLVSNADPAGMVRENMQLLDTNKGLQAMYRNRTDELDRAKEVLELARNGLAWYRDTYPAADSGADDEMMAAIDEVLK